MRHRSIVILAAELVLACCGQRSHSAAPISADVDDQADNLAVNTAAAEPAGIGNGTQP